MLHVKNLVQVMCRVWLPACQVRHAVAYWGTYCGYEARDMAADWCKRFRYSAMCVLYVVCGELVRWFQVAVCRRSSVGTLWCNACLLRCWSSNTVFYRLVHVLGLCKKTTVG